jgi:hypothetical protein
MIMCNKQVTNATIHGLYECRLLYLGDAEPPTLSSASMPKDWGLIILGDVGPDVNSSSISMTLIRSSLDISQ